MNLTAKIFIAGALAWTVSGRAGEIQLITLDPGHFHAALVQKASYPDVNPTVHVYAPAGSDVQEHLARIEAFNTRAENPTHWQEKVYTGPDFLEKLLKEKPGNLVVISGNNARKTEYIYRCVDAGLNVLADKPMAIDAAGFVLLKKAFQRATEKKVLLYDIMTERYEIDTILQRAVSQAPAVFGELVTGAPDQPAIAMESVHRYAKLVAGKPLIRPPWFFDIAQQGEALPDVGTHLVDLIQWACFPEKSLGPDEVKLLSARRWATKLTPAQFQQVTGLASFPDYLKKEVGPDGALSVFQNGEMTYTLRGIHARVSVLWSFDGGPDTHYSIMRGTKANAIVENGRLRVETKGDAQTEPALRAALAPWPGVDVKKTAAGWEVIVPASYKVGHEAHFAQVTQKYLRFLADRQMPEWEVPNMILKYSTTTRGFEVSHGKN